MKSRYIYVAIAVLMIAAVAYPVVVSAFNSQKTGGPFFCEPLIPCTKESPGYVLCIPSCTIVMQDSTFVPGTINATAGAAITWHNLDGFSHTVTFFNTTLPSSGFVPPGHSFTYTIPMSIAPGKYFYFCNVHPFMIGLLDVLPSNSTS